MTLTKAELIDTLCSHVGLNQREAKEMVEALFEELAGCLERGQEIKLSGFGVFTVRQKEERPGRNPKTGEAAPIAARRVVTFHPSGKLKDAVEQGVRPPQPMTPGPRALSRSSTPGKP
jgi:integration host factor subunit alpha